MSPGGLPSLPNSPAPSRPLSPDYYRAPRGAIHSVTTKANEILAGVPRIVEPENVEKMGAVVVALTGNLFTKVAATNRKFLRVALVDGETVPAGEMMTINGEYGTLVMQSDGVFRYVLSANLVSDSADQEVEQFLVNVQAGGDAGYWPMYLVVRVYDYIRAHM